MLNICNIIVIMLKGCCGDLISEYIHKPIEQFLTHSKCSVKIMLLLSLLFLLRSVLVLRTFFHHIFLNSFTPWICMMLVYHVLTSMLWIFWNLTFTVLKIKKPFGLYWYGSSWLLVVFQDVKYGFSCPWILISSNLPTDFFQSVVEVNVC